MENRKDPFTLAGHLRSGIMHFLKRLLYWKWVAHTRMCRRVSVHSDSKVTILLTAYNKNRIRNLDPLVRSVLRCSFVEKVIVSNDNPQLRIADWVKVHDEKLLLMDQPVRRGGKYRWELAWAENAAYYIAIDDDVLIYPKQLARLFMHLINRQEVPHGLSGCTFPYEFHERKEMEVDLLFEIYALSREHLRVYFDYIERMKECRYLPQEDLDKRGDFVVISHSGKGRPLIHDVGFISRCATAYTEGVATFKEEDFLQCTALILTAVKKVLK